MLRTKIARAASLMLDMSRLVSVRIRQWLLPSFVVGCFATTSSAQNFNVDFNHDGFSPACGFGGNAAQRGAWNTIGAFVPLPAPLLDANGNTTNVTLKLDNITYWWVHQACQFFPGGRERLLRDGIVTPHAQPAFIRIEGLAAGDYEVTTYGVGADPVPGWGPLRVRVQGVSAMVNYTCADNASHAVTHQAQVACGETLSIQIKGTQSISMCNGIQIRRLDGGAPMGTEYCAIPGKARTLAYATYVDQALEACDSIANEPSIAKNDLLLFADGIPTGELGQFFYGTAQPPAPFGLGYLCVSSSGSFGRFPMTPECGGTIQTLVDYNNPPNSMVAITAGSTWSFQCWFRSQGSWDLSSAVTMSFQP